MPRGDPTGLIAAASRSVRIYPPRMRGVNQWMRLAHREQPTARKGPGGSPGRVENADLDLEQSGPGSKSGAHHFN
jgi:hypothetical protein